MKTHFSSNDIRQKSGSDGYIQKKKINHQSEILITCSIGCSSDIYWYGQAIKKSPKRICSQQLHGLTDQFSCTAYSSRGSSDTK